MEVAKSIFIRRVVNVWENLLLGRRLAGTPGEPVFDSRQ